MERHSKPLYKHLQVLTNDIILCFLFNDFFLCLYTLVFYKKSEDTTTLWMFNECCKLNYFLLCMAAVRLVSRVVISTSVRIMEIWRKPLDYPSISPAYCFHIQDTCPQAFAFTESGIMSLDIWMQLTSLKINYLQNTFSSDALICQH